MKVNLIFNNIGLTKEKQKENIGHRQLHIIYFSYLLTLRYTSYEKKTLRYTI